jgi:hypothetical protein
MVGLLVLMLALYILFASARNMHRRPEMDQAWPPAFRSVGSMHLGSEMLFTIAGAAFFFAMNAGLSRIGL